jgi:hypothetical protein
VTGAGRTLSIDDVLVSEEVRRIRREGWSGVLALTQGRTSKGIYFLEGDIAFAASTEEEDRLGANLVRIGRITEVQFRAAMAAAQAPGQRLGQALIAAGVLDPTELAAAVTGQVERIVFSVLRWTKGQMQCRGMDRPLPLDLLLDLNTPRILLLGARTFPDAERLEGVLGGAASKLGRLSHPPFDYEALPSSPPERAVLALCARPTSLGEVLRLPHPRPRLIRAVYALLAGEMVAREDAADLPGVHLPAGTPLPTLEADPEPEVEEPFREEVAGTPSSSSPETIERRARDLLEKGRRPEAVELLSAVVTEHPNALACRKLLVTARAHDGGFDPEVERLFLDILELEPGDVGLRYRLATYYRRAGMRARAMLQIRLVLSSDPGHAGAWRDLGELEAGEGSRSR